MFLPSSLPIILIEEFFAETDAGGGDFGVLVFLDVFDGAFEADRCNRG